MSAKSDQSPGLHWWPRLLEEFPARLRIAEDQILIKLAETGRKIGLRIAGHRLQIALDHNDGCGKNERVRAESSTRILVMRD
jgi:hypothetical protein